VASLNEQKDVKTIQAQLVQFQLTSINIPNSPSVTNARYKRKQDT